jgi:histidinol dehydrogenase
VPHELDQILISESQPDFKKRLEGFFFSKAGLAAFGIGDMWDEDGKLNEESKFIQAIRILIKVMNEGDKAVTEYTEKFDDVCLTPQQFKVTQKELKEAHEKINKKLLESIRQAIANVKEYQKEIFIGHDISGKITYTPIQRVGICVPGASAPLPSTVIMTAVPAIVAGVKPKNIVIVSPPRYKGSIHPTILAACHELKIENVYRVGGAQAVAALAAGTQTIGKVDKIVGPGNQWVQTAKKEFFGSVGIDPIAGPSEVLIIANEKANPAWISADMLSQAEHDPGCAFLFTDSKRLAEKVLDELKEQVKKLTRSEETIKCLKKFSGIAVFNDLDYAIDKANEFAAEHLEIQCGDDSKEIAKKIDNAGAIFIGDYSPVAVGDYWAGPSHTLPTGISALFASALSANDFIKSTSIIEYDKEKLTASADDIIRLAEAEGLDAHAKSIKIRQKTGQK